MKFTKVIIIIQRICAHYNVSLFQRLTNIDSMDLTLYYGESGKGKNNKLKNVDNIEKFKHKKLLTFSYQFRLKWQLFPLFLNPKLLFHLFKYRSDVIICEGESKLLNNISIVLYTKITRTSYLWWRLGRVRSNKLIILRKILHPLFKYLLKNAAAILTYSSFAKEFYSSYGINKNKIFVTYNCIDADKATQDIKKFSLLVKEQKLKLGLDNKKIILFIGSFAKEKKIENLILAYEQIKQQISNVALLLVSDGETKKIWKIGLKKKMNDVVFVGRKIEDISLYFLMGDIFVLLGEGGISINQAMVNDLPIVTALADGTKLDMVLDRENGFIMKQKDSQEIAQIITELLENKDFGDKISQNAYQTAKQYNIDKISDIYYQVFNHVLNAN